MRDVNDILKPGWQTKIKIRDYSSAEQKNKLQDLRKRRDAVLSSKNVNWDKLSRTYMNL